MGASHMVEDVPLPVKKAFQRLQETHSGCLQLKRNRGHHHVHLATSFWDKHTKKPRKKTEHIGTITPQGVFRPKGTPRKKTGSAEPIELSGLHFGVLATQLMDGTLSPNDVMELLDQIGKKPVPLPDLEAVGIRFEFQKKRLTLYLYPKPSEPGPPKPAPASKRGASRKPKPAPG